MDALIMAAGRGSRLAAETDGRPKSLVDLGGISPLALQLDLLMSRGVSRMIIATGYERAAVEAAVLTRLRPPTVAEFVWNPFWSFTNVIASAWLARDRLRGDFVYLHADTVFEPSILDDLLASGADAVLPIDVRECEPEEMKAALDDDRVLHLSKELPASETAGEFIGVGLFRSGAVSRVVEGLDAELAAGGIGSYFEAAVNRAIEAGLVVRSIPTAGRAWVEIDFPADLALARSLLPRLRI